jgi:hypothetical protein
MHMEVRVQVITTASMEITAFLDVASYITNCTDVSEVRTASIIIALMMVAVRTSETSVYLKETTWSYIPEDSRLRARTTLTSATYNFIYIRAI